MSFEQIKEQNRGFYNYIFSIYLCVLVKILILRFSSIGDIVLTTPVIRCLANQLEDSHITYATKSQYSHLLENHPQIDRVVALKEDWGSFITELKSEKYDVIIDLHHNLRTLRVKTALKTKSYAVNKLNLKKFLLVQFKWNKMPQKHVVDRYFEAATPLGIKNDGKGIDFFIPPNVVWREDFPEKKSFHAYCIGGQFSTKKMPPKKIVELIDSFSKPVILIGGPEDVEAANWILDKTTNQTVTSFCGKTGLIESALLVKNSLGVFTHDTGMMHIASAFDVPIVSIWGNTVPGFGMYPYREKDTAIIEKVPLSCRPCSKIGFQKCPKKHFKCMDHEVKNITEAMNEISKISTIK